MSPYPQHKVLQQDYLSGLEAAESMPVKAQVAEEKLQQQERSSDKRWRREASGHNQDLHAQIMASLQGRDESSPEVHDEKPDMTPEEELAESTRPKGPSDEVEEKLHGLVKVRFMIIFMNAILTYCPDSTWSSPNQGSDHLRRGRCLSKERYRLRGKD